MQLIYAQWRVSKDDILRLMKSYSFGWSRWRQTGWFKSQTFIFSGLQQPHHGIHSEIQIGKACNFLLGFPSKTLPQDTIIDTKEVLHN